MKPSLEYRGRVFTYGDEAMPRYKLKPRNRLLYEGSLYGEGLVSLVVLDAWEAERLRSLGHECDPASAPKEEVAPPSIEAIAKITLIENALSGSYNARISLASDLGLLDGLEDRKDVTITAALKSHLTRLEQQGDGQ